MYFRRTYRFHNPHRIRQAPLRISRDGHVLECVFFSVTADEFILKAGAIADFAFEPVINEFRGNRSVQLLRDVRPSKRHIEMEKQICKSFFGNGPSSRAPYSAQAHGFCPRMALYKHLLRTLSGDVDDIVFRIAFDSASATQEKHTFA